MGVPTMSRQKESKLKMSPAAKEPDQSTYAGRFAARLRILREKSKLTVDEMVEAIKQNGYDLKNRTYYAWETGQNEPKLDAFPAIAAALGLKKIRDLLPVE